MSRITFLGKITKSVYFNECPYNNGKPSTKSSCFQRTPLDNQCHKKCLKLKHFNSADTPPPSFLFFFFFINKGITSAVNTFKTF